MKKYKRVKARRILDVYMTIKDIKFSNAAKFAEMQRIEKMTDSLLRWMAGYCGKRSFNPFHWLDVFIIGKFGIKLEADHWLADPQRLGKCISNTNLFINNG